MATCSEWYCSPNACEIFEFFDALQGASISEDVKGIKGNPPTSPSIIIGSVTFKVEGKTTGLVSTIQSVSVSPSISLTKNIPGAVKSKAIEYIQEKGDGWLNGASTQDGKAKVVAEASNSDWQDLIEASIGLKGRGAWLPKGASYGKPVWTKTTSVTYYTEGSFEGCELGTSDSYAADGYPCGYGKFEINGNLLWQRPSNPTLFTIGSIQPIFNPCLVFC
jgi:hypothetical protein